MKMKKNVAWGIRILFVLTPWISGMVYCLMQNISILEIYNPGGYWNDEVSYYKQIEGMVENGIPKGYFAYNDSKAPIGSMGPWCILLFLPYAFYGKIFGWSYISPILCNILFLTLGFLGFMFFSKKDCKTLLAVSVLYIFNPLLTRYLLSGMAEPFFFMCMLLYAGLVIRCWEEEKENKLRYIIGIFGLCGYLTIIRPYVVILLIIPTIELVKLKGKKSIFVSGIIMSLGVALFYIINSNFCAPYFTAMPYVASIELLKSGQFISAIEYLWLSFVDYIKTIVFYVEKTFSIGYAEGEMYAYYGVYLLLVIVQCIFEKNKKYVMILVESLLIAIAIFVFYRPQPGARNIMMLSVLFIVFIACASKKLAAYIIVALAFFVTVPRNTDVYTLPARTEEKTEYTKEYEEMFSEYIILAEEVSWENSVMWIMNDTNEDNTENYVVPYNILYALPKGSGFSVTQGTYVLAKGTDGIYSKYILTPSKGRVNELLIEKGCVLLDTKDDINLLLNVRYK
ncbi:MAG: hypothetical protein IJF03_06820 [Lachnospiraceae bacterium]|nr:hypothetical protein [Lachnospiraceae bacterium]